VHSGKPLSFEFYLVFNTRLSLSVSRLVDLLEVNSVAVEIQLAFASTMRFLFFSLLALHKAERGVNGSTMIEVGLLPTVLYPSQDLIV